LPGLIGVLCLRIVQLWLDSGDVETGADFSPARPDAIQGRLSKGDLERADKILRMLSCACSSRSG
jgi:hypothetical protein